MRNLCEYELKTNRLCKNYKFSDTYCYLHNYINEFNFVMSWFNFVMSCFYSLIWSLIDLSIFLTSPLMILIFVLMTVETINMYNYNNIYELDEFFM